MTRSSISRRKWLGSGLAVIGGGMATARLANATASGSSEQVAAGPPCVAAPLAQDYTVVFERQDEKYYVEGCGLARLDDGTLVAVVPVVPRSNWRNGPSSTHIVRSDDDGRNWREVSQLPYYTAIPWVHDNSLYLFACRSGTDFRNDDLLLLRSADAGRTWSEPVTLFRGHFWNCHTGMVQRDGRIYWAIDELQQANNIQDRSPRALAGSLDDPMNPKSWRMSNFIKFPGVPAALRRQGKAAQKLGAAATHGRWLEPNVVDVRGRLRMMARLEVQKLTTSNLCAIFDLHDDGQELELELAQFYPMTGGHLKFYMLYDEPSRMFWATANFAVDSQESLDWWDKARKEGDFNPSFTAGNDRRLLMLLYSLDALNWFPAGCIAQAAWIRQSFMYATPLVAGDDLLVVSRSSVAAPNPHDADKATFHRVKDFRRLALNLFPQAPQ